MIFNINSTFHSLSCKPLSFLSLTEINSVDIDSRILAIYAVLAKRNGKNDLAKSYLDRSIKNGLTKTYLESQIIDENIRKETIKELLEINYFD